MHRLLIAAVLATVAAMPAAAQSWVPWYQPSLLEPEGRQRRAEPAPPPAAKKKKKTARAALAAPAAAAPAPPPPSLTGPDDEDAPAAPPAPIVMDGGARPEIAPKAPGTSERRLGQPAGTIVIDTAARRLYLVQSATTALVYPISVGRDGFTWTGAEKISRIASWPDWHPPAEMRERDPKLPHKMTGGIKNPLGAMALYLGNTLYRIHGTSDARSIGRAASSGCFRMLNSHVTDLASRVSVGTRVVVINAPAAQTAAVVPSAPPGRRQATGGPQAASARRQVQR